jgi:HAD superfamily hydrolase (TIGR01490 family)
MRTNTVAAFFDVDDTLISIKSMFSFLDYLQQTCGATDPILYKRCEQIRHHKKTSGLRREELNQHYYEVLSGLRVDQVTRLGRDWYASVATKKGFFFEEMVNTLIDHIAKGHDVVLVSGSFSALLEPIAQDLKVTTTIGADLEVKDGCYTGKLTREPNIGQGKANRIREYAECHNISLTESYAYADDVSDQQMLSCVGNPCLVNPKDDFIKQFSSSTTQLFSVLVV